METVHPEAQGSGKRMPEEGAKLQVGGHAVRGFVWLAGATLAGKVTAFGGQVLLAWLLEREHFGSLSLALTVTSFTGLLTNLGIRDVLVRRQAEFTNWSGSALRLSAIVGVASALLTVAVAPIAASVYEERELIPVLIVLASALPFSTIAIVPEAYLDTQLRFRTTASVSFIASFAVLALSVVFAWLGMGTMSLALPRLLVPVVRAVALWLIARPPLRGPNQHGFAGLIPDGLRIFGFQALLQLLLQGDYIALGIWRTADEVGLYFFAFNLSVQVIQLLTVNVSNVLFPVFSKIGNDPARQSEAFIKAVRILALTGVPLLLLQAAVADPLVRLLFDHRWHAAGPLLALLSFSMAVRVASGAGASLLKAQGRFSALLVAYAFLTASFIAAICPAAAFGGTTGVAVTVALWSTIPGFAIPILAVRGQGRTAVKQVVSALGLPIVVAAGAIGLGYLSASWIADSSRATLLARIVLTGCVGVACYALIMHRLAPAWWNEATARIRQFRRGGVS